MDLLAGFVIALEPLNILIAFTGTAIGIIFGAIPGLTSTMAVGLLIPVSLNLPPASGLIFLAGAYCGSMYGGSISAILLNTPGTPAAIATSIDGYPMTMKGQSGKALAVATIASFTGSVASVTALIFLAPPLARIALLFGPAEYFAIGCLGMSVIASLSAGALLKGCIAGLLGLFLGAVGMDPLNGIPRFTFNQLPLLEGLPVVPALIGLFSMSQVLMLLESMPAPKTDNVPVKAVSGRVWISWDELKSIQPDMVRGSCIGTIIGIIPAAGGDVAAFMGYSAAKHRSKEKELFGKGHMAGVAGAESANNGVMGGSLIPLLTLGIPGNSVTAVFMGGLLIQGLRPGPGLFNEQAAITYAFFAGMVVACIALLILGFLGIRIFTKLLDIPLSVIIPLIICLCCIGSFAIRNALFDVGLMIGFGILGLFLRKTGFNLAPVVLGMILSPMIEANYQRFMLSNSSNFFAIANYPIAVAIFAVCLLLLAGPALIRLGKSRRKA